MTGNKRNSFQIGRNRGGIFFLAAIVFPLVLSCEKATADQPLTMDLFGPHNEVDYLQGRFDPEKSPLFIPLKQTKIPHRGNQILRKETVQALEKMLDAFHRDHPGIPVRVISSTRVFSHQKAIWEAKWNGNRLVDGKKLNRSLPDPDRRALKILEYSSMPGTSRHHWGTDLDLNDLNNSYFEKGEGKVLFQWLTKNAKDYGFCRPYTAGRQKGYNEEKWHWSYRPIAGPLTRQWLKKYHESPGSFFSPGAFDGAKSSQKYASIYVSSISAECLE